MAKLKAPLLSLGASGAIAKAIVYFPWKGLNCAREYIIPSNPKTSGQTTIRGYLTAAVAMVHAAQALAADALDEADQMAYALLGSLQATPRTWFNTFCKQYIDQHVAAKKGAIYTNLTVTPGVDKLTVMAQFTKEGANDIAFGNIWWGTSKSNMPNSVACTGVELKAGKDTGVLVTGVKYYVQFRPTGHDDFIGANSGIGYGVPT